MSKTKVDNKVLCPYPNKSGHDRILMADDDGVVDILNGVCEHTKDCKVDCCMMGPVTFDVWEIF